MTDDMDVLDPDRPGATSSDVRLRGMVEWMTPEEVYWLHEPIYTGMIEALERSIERHRSRAVMEPGMRWYWSEMVRMEEFLVSRHREVLEQMRRGEYRVGQADRRRYRGDVGRDGAVEKSAWPEGRAAQEALF